VIDSTAAVPAPGVSGLGALEAPARRQVWSTSDWRRLAFGLGLVLVLACAMRLWKIQDVPGNVFYDAAVRSMAFSWHNFFFGALEPSGTVSIDKPPVDLWLQVASTRVFGFGPLGLHLPEALGGVLACGLLFGALRAPFGYAVAFPSALALAVLPASVLTARSDTMDSVLAALEVAALWLSWQALHSGRLRWAVAAAAVMGVAFNVKLAEMLIALPAFALLWLWAAPGARLRVALAAGATFLVVAFSWTAIASVTPLNRRPFPIGSSNGSIWHVTLIYNGLNRLSGQGVTGKAEGGASALRLFSAGPLQYWTLIGIALLVTCLLALSALVTILSQDGMSALAAAFVRPSGRFLAGILVWFLTGLIVFSAMERLQPRYLEAFAPALCAIFGLSVGVLWRGGLGRGGRRGESGEGESGGGGSRGGGSEGGGSEGGEPGRGGSRRDGTSTERTGRRIALRGALVCLGVGLLAVSLAKDAYLVNRARSDSLLTDFSTPALGRFLRVHRDGARYEVAGANVNDTIGIVARDGHPALVLNSVDGSLTRTARLRAEVGSGLVRFYFAASHTCHEGPHCEGNQVWAYDHSIPVAGQPGLRRFTPR
jgi:Dolichyl-phosphate-mannose-protein mannosyltransferase